MISNEKRDKATFERALRTQRDLYLAERSPYANMGSHIKSAIFIGSAIWVWQAIVWNDASVFSMIGLWAMLGFIIALLGFLSHEIIHGAYFKNPLLTRIVGDSLFGLIGANAHIWRYMHHGAHHPATNEERGDQDLEMSNLIRLAPWQGHYPHHKYQQWYAWPLLMLATLLWVFWKDYYKFSQKKIGNVKTEHSSLDLFRLIFFKACYYCLFLVIPIITVDQPWYVVIGGFLLMHAVEGVFLGVTFMMAHVVEGPELIPAEEVSATKKKWGFFQRQIRTTANFAMDSWLVTWLLCGLNYQVEHHLFHQINHRHYPALAALVESVCKEYKVPYYKKRTVADAMKSHFRFLYKMGRMPEDAST